MVPPLVPGVAVKVPARCRVWEDVGVSVIAHVRMYCSVGPDPEVLWVHAGLLEVEVASSGVPRAACPC